MNSLLDHFTWQVSDQVSCNRAPCLVSRTLTMALLALALSFVSCGGVTGHTPGPGSGGGNGQPQLSTSPSSVSFGDVVVGTTNTLPITLTNSGNASLSVSRVMISGSGFSMIGILAPLTLAASQNITITVEFNPREVRSVTGSVSLISNAPTSPNTISLNGTGVQTTSHSVTLNWDPSTSAVIGYNVYRGTQSGGPYIKLNSHEIPATTYADSSVDAGETYFYVATAVDSNNDESPYSKEVSATIPTP